MTRFSTESFYKVVDNISIKSNDSLFIHSSLISLGIPNDISLSAFSNDIVTYLFEKVGSKGNIIVPTFNFDFFETKYFNRATTPSKGMGSISELVRKHPSSVRSCHPIQSIAVLGGDSYLVNNKYSSSAFELGGDFDIIANKDCKILLLGATFKFISFIHFVEENLKVPYRYYKSYSGVFEDSKNGIIEERSYKFFARKLELDIKLNLNPLYKLMLYNGLIEQISFGDGFISLLSLNDFLTITKSQIENNPYFLTTHS